MRAGSVEALYGSDFTAIVSNRLTVASGADSNRGRHKLERTPLLESGSFVSEHSSNEIPHSAEPRLYVLMRNAWAVQPSASTQNTQNKSPALSAPLTTGAGGDRKIHPYGTLSTGLHCRNEEPSGSTGKRGAAVSGIGGTSEFPGRNELPQPHPVGTKCVITHQQVNWPGWPFKVLDIVTAGPLTVPMVNLDGITRVHQEIAQDHGSVYVHPIEWLRPLDDHDDDDLAVIDEMGVRHVVETV